MNKKSKLIGLIEFTFGIILISMYLSFRGSQDTRGFIWVFVITSAVVGVLSMVSARAKYRLLITYIAFMLSYFTCYFVFFPDVFSRIEIGIISLIIMAPLFLFVIIQLFKFEIWGKFRPKITTKWHVIRFWLIFASLSVLITGIVFYFYPDLKKYGNLFIAPGTYFLAPFGMLVMGYANYEVIGRFGELDNLERKSLYLNIFTWLLYISFFFNSPSSNPIAINIVLVALQVITLLYVIEEKNTHKKLYENLMEYNPIRPNKNSFNEAVAGFIVIVIQVGAIVYMVFVVITAFDLLQVQSWSEYLIEWEITIEFELQKDPFMFLYFFIGMASNFLHKTLQKGQSIFKK